MCTGAIGGDNIGHPNSAFYYLELRNVILFDENVINYRAKSFMFSNI